MVSGIRDAFRRIFKRFSKSHEATDCHPTDDKYTVPLQGRNYHAHTSTTSPTLAAVTSATNITHLTNKNNLKVTRNASELPNSPAPAHVGISRVKADDTTVDFAHAVLGESKPAYLSRMPISTTSNSSSNGIRSQNEFDTQSSISPKTRATVSSNPSSIHSKDDHLLTLSQPTYLRRMPLRNGASPASERNAEFARTLIIEYKSLTTPPPESDDLNGLTRDGTAIMILTPPLSASNSITSTFAAANSSKVSNDKKHPVGQASDICNKDANLSSSTVTDNTVDIKGPIITTPSHTECGAFTPVPGPAPPSTPPRKGTRYFAPRPCTPRFPSKKTSNTRFVKTNIDPLLIDAYRASMPQYTRQPGNRRHSKVPHTPNRSTRMATDSPYMNPRMTPSSNIKHRNAEHLSFRRFVGHNCKKTLITKENFIRRGKCCDVEEVLSAGNESSDEDEDEEDVAFFERLTRWTKADKNKCKLAEYHLQRDQASPTTRLAVKAAHRDVSDDSDESGSDCDTEDEQEHESGSDCDTEDEQEQESVWEHDWDSNADISEGDSQGVDNMSQAEEEGESIWESDWDSDADMSEGDLEGVDNITKAEQEEERV